MHACKDDTCKDDTRQDDAHKDYARKDYARQDDACKMTHARMTRARMIPNTRAMLRERTVSTDQHEDAQMKPMTTMLVANVKMTKTVANTKMTMMVTNMDHSSARMTMMVANMCHINARTMMVVPRIHLHLMVRNETVLLRMLTNVELRHIQVLMVFFFYKFMFYTSLLIYIRYHDA
jgi:hypothetical protein